MVIYTDYFLSFLVILISIGPTTHAIPLTRSKRVVNGSISSPGQWPWLVSIKNVEVRSLIEKSLTKYMNWDTVGNDSHICGAALLSTRWIVSAKHCVEFEGVTIRKGWKAVLGAYDLRHKSVSEQIIEIDDLKLIYNQSEYDDIVFMHLAKSADINNFVKPVCVYNQSLDPEGLQCIGMGWGSTVSITENSLSPVPKYYEAKLIDVYDSSCLQSFNDSQTICFRSLTGLGCRGDSGGPMVCRNGMKDKWKLAGVASGATGCSDPTDRIVYTNISHFLSFVDLSKELYCSHCPLQTNLQFITLIVTISLFMLLRFGL